MTSTCSADDCPRPSYSRGLCRGHYMRLLRHGPDAVNAGPLHEYRRPPEWRRAFSDMDKVREALAKAQMPWQARLRLKKLLADADKMPPPKGE